MAVQPSAAKPTRLILRNPQALGDSVMLTAAVRDLHRCYPGRFSTDVRTRCPAVWENNPYLTAIDDTDPAAKIVDCRYPLIEMSNRFPYHFIHGFVHHLNLELGVGVCPTEFRGDIHLSPEESSMPSVTELRFGRHVPYWLILSGGKRDFTVKWWEASRWQAVVDSLLGKMLFVQVGDEDDYHPPLRHVIDLRGQTSQRELILLVYRAQGAVCPVTGVMHLCAAVPPTLPLSRPRPCVVVAGGREPPHWEAYPLHQFLHTVGMLPCCGYGGCWRSRVSPLGDGSEHDDPGRICVRPATESLPECMAMIEPEAVVQAVQGYFRGGACEALSAEARDVIAASGIWGRK